MRMLIYFVLLFGSAIAQGDEFDYKGWWEWWYSRGGISGPGSRGILAEYKAEVLNDFISKHKIKSTIEFGCGDGYNLSLINYDTYHGLDVSPTAVKLCNNLFQNDKSKSFELHNPKTFKREKLGTFDLVVCLDVLYHITDETEYIKTLDDLFSFSAPYVILYTTLVDDGVPHGCLEIKHRDIFPYLQKYTNYEYTILEQPHFNLSKAQFIILTKKTFSK